ncbi:hypothetical protein BSKO_01562 [Bryopsis sp. KO-2023]|nr:hypothetical protein BSKO_01562 [Bryopsis sp. KO-2023]
MRLGRRITGPASTSQPIRPCTRCPQFVRLPHAKPSINVRRGACSQRVTPVTAQWESSPTTTKKRTTGPPMTPPKAPQEGGGGGGGGWGGNKIRNIALNVAFLGLYFILEGTGGGGFFGGGQPPQVQMREIGDSDDEDESEAQRERAMRRMKKKK